MIETLLIGALVLLLIITPQVYASSDWLRAVEKCTDIYQKTKNDSANGPYYQCMFKLDNDPKHNDARDE